jgi:hypothetical protein
MTGALPALAPSLPDRGNESDEGIIESEEQQQAIECVVDRRQIIVLLLVENHEAVVLFDEVVISPQRGEEEKDQPQTGQNHNWSNRKERQRAPQQTAAIHSLGAIEVGAREGAEDVGCVNQDRPERHHRNQGYHSRNVKDEQRIAGDHRPDEPDKIVTRANESSAARGRGFEFH